MESLPPALLDFISMFRPLLRTEVFDSFTYLLCGLLIGEAKHGTVRASVFAPAHYQPQRLSDLFCCHKLSRQALMAQLTQGVLTTLYGGGLPTRLFWLADSTLTERPFVRRVASVGLFHRAKRVIGRAKHLQGQCYVFAAHLYQTAQKHWASALVGALLYVKGRSIPRLVGDLAQQLRLPAEVRHVWVVDRGIVSRPLVQSLERLDQYVLGRVRSNQVFYFAPRRQPRRGRRRSYGQKCRVDKLIKRFPERLHHQTALLKVRGKARTVRIYDAEMLWRGVWHDRPCPVHYRARARAEVKTLVSAHHRSGAHPVGGRPGLWRTPADRSQLRRGQRVGLGAVSRPQWQRRTPLAGLLVHRSCAVEVAGDPSSAHRVALAQLVVVQAGKHSRPSPTTLN
jgi:hypothetical protein